ncbi:MAG TPA: hypothetical protein VE242_12995, partial [Chthoniobacterales bacterium]|nr:hypothetical protein [Chthoniobacterales bacterium]
PIANYLGHMRHGAPEAPTLSQSPSLRRPAIRLTAGLFFLALAVCLVELIWAYNRLPELVRAHFPSWIHFGAEGPRWVFIVATGAIPVLIALAALISIHLLRSQPDKFVQIPNRDYWMAPARREQTLDLIASRIYLLGAVKFVADAVFIYAAVRANLTGTSELDPTLLFSLACAFVIVKVALAAQLFWRFQHPEQ